MSHRISPVAAPGSLLKGAEPKAKRRAHNKEPHHNTNYLDKVRQMPCLACDRAHAGVAAHVRMTGGPDKQQALGKKPADRWTIPLCHDCHMRQHSVGEKPFWLALKLDPLALCLKLYLARGSIRDMAKIIHEARSQHVSKDDNHEDKLL